MSTRPSTRLRLAAILLLALPVAAACGDGEDTGGAEPTTGGSASETTSEPSPEPSSEPTPTTEPSPSGTAGTTGASGPVPATGSAGVTEAVVVSGSEVGGEVSPLAFPLQSSQEREDFGAVFQRGFGAEVARAASGVRSRGTSTWGAVVAVACEGPTSVRIDAGEAGYEVTPTLPKSTVQCLVPVTYVVVFAAPTAY